MPRLGAALLAMTQAAPPDASLIPQVAPPSRRDRPEQGLDWSSNVTARRHTPRVAAAKPRTPFTFLRKLSRSDRSETRAQGRRRGNRGLGDVSRNQRVAPRLRSERPERLEISPTARAWIRAGLGGTENDLALVAVSGRSRRSSRDPPTVIHDFNGLRWCRSSGFRALLSVTRTGQSVSYLSAINILIASHLSQQNLANRGFLWVLCLKELRSAF